MSEFISEFWEAEKERQNTLKFKHRRSSSYDRPHSKIFPVFKPDLISNRERSTYQESTRSMQPSDPYSPSSIDYTDSNDSTELSLMLSDKISNVTDSMQFNRLLDFDEDSRAEMMTITEADSSNIDSSNNSIETTESNNTSTSSGSNKSNNLSTSP
ncbi:13976_t:CDS:2, partial [Ambispora leptoticha]